MTFVCARAASTSSVLVMSVGANRQLAPVRTLLLISHKTKRTIATEGYLLFVAIIIKKVENHILICAKRFTHILFAAYCQIMRGSPKGFLEFGGTIPFIDFVLKFLIRNNLKQRRVKKNWKNNEQN
jgi:hypothetical protein